MDLQFESTKLRTPWGYISAIALCATTFGIVALMSGFFLKPDVTWDDYISTTVPFFGGFISILEFPRYVLSYNFIGLYVSNLLYLCKW